TSGASRDSCADNSPATNVCPHQWRARLTSTAECATTLVNKNYLRNSPSDWWHRFLDSSSSFPSESSPRAAIEPTLSQVRVVVAVASWANGKCSNLTGRPVAVAEKVDEGRAG